MLEILFDETLHNESSEYFSGKEKSLIHMDNLLCSYVYVCTCSFVTAKPNDWEKEEEKRIDCKLSDQSELCERATT